jgi:aspartate aminotransferase-like enzyme
MTDSSFSPADAEGLTAWFARAEANAAGLRRWLRDFGTDQRPHHRDRHKDLKASTAALTSEGGTDRIQRTSRRVYRR